MHVIGYFQPELGYQEYFLAREQVKLGHEVWVVCSDLIYPYRTTNRSLFQRTFFVKSRKRAVGYSVFEGIKIVRLPHVVEFNDCVFTSGLSNVLKRVKPDVIHAHEARQGLPALVGRYRRKMNFKYVLDHHDYGLIFENRSLLPKIEYFFFRKYLVNYALRRADKIIAVIDKAKQFLIKRHKISNQKIKIIPLGADTELYKFDFEQRRKIRNELKIPAEAIVFLFSGYAYPYKKLELLIKAFIQLANEVDNVYLILICGGSEMYIQFLKSLAGRNKQKKIIFLDFMRKENLAAYFSCADVGVFPAVPSISILEQMACGLAIISPELTQSYIQDNAIVYNQISENALYSAMQTITREKNLLNKLKENSLTLVKKQFSWKKIALQFLHEYQS